MIPSAQLQELAVLAKPRLTIPYQTTYVGSQPSCRVVYCSVLAVAPRTRMPILSQSRKKTRNSKKACSWTTSLFFLQLKSPYVAISLIFRHIAQAN